MSYVPTKVPSVLDFRLTVRDYDVIMVCQGCYETIVVLSLQQAVAQADLHEQEKHPYKVCKPTGDNA